MADSSLLSLLNEIAVKLNYLNPKIVVTPTSTKGANFSSRLYRIQITGDGKEELRLFAKIASFPEKMREQCVMNLFANERFLYTELITLFRQLEEKWKVSEEHKIVIPTYYGADPTYLKEIIVLEDLACKGFQPQSRLEVVSWQYAAAAITQLAKFHALSFVYKHENPTGFEDVTKMLKSGLYSDNEGNKVFYNGSSKTALENVTEENKGKLQRFLDGTSLADMCSMNGPLLHPVIIHADFRPSNMLHKVRNDGTVELIVVDYQTFQAGCPIIDLLQFIFAATDGPFRAHHYQELIDHYHSELGTALVRFGLDVEDTYSRADFEFELREKLSYGLKQSVLALPMALLPEDLALPQDEELDMANMVVPTGPDYVKRLNEVVDDYVAWGILV